MLTKLEERGLIERKLDRGDRRRVLIELTKLGRRSLEDHRVFSGTALAMAAKRLSPAQQRTAADAIGALVGLAREVTADEAND